MYSISYTIYLLLMKSSILVGGQAVIEGVMMRVPGAYATAVRLKDNTISYQRHEFKSVIERHNLQNIYFLRGMIHLFESMKIGYSTLDFSAQLFEDQETKNNKIVDILMTFLSVFFALSLFVFLPLWSTSYLFENYINQPLVFNVISGSIRITIFLSYLIIISRLDDVKRLFEYHGAEHKVVYNFDSFKFIF